MMIQKDTYFFNSCIQKLEMYIRTGKKLISKVWDDLWVTKKGNDISFYNGCDLIWEFSSGSYEQNLENAVLWLLDGAKDPLHHYN